MNSLIKNLKQNPFAMISGVFIGIMLVHIYIWARTGDTPNMLFTQSILLAALMPLILKRGGSKGSKKSKK